MSAGLLLALATVLPVHGAATVEALLAAAQHGNVAELQNLLASGLDVNAVNAEGRSALEIAARYGQLACAQTLLERGATVDIRNQNGGTPLIFAAQSGQVTVVKLLLDHGADVHAEASNRASPLRVAAYHDQLEVVDVLLQHGAGIRRTGRHDLDVFDSPMIEIPYQVEPKLELQELDGAIALATSAGHARIVKRLLEARRHARLIPLGSVEVQKCALCQATLRGDLRALREQLRRGDGPGMEELGLSLHLAEQDGLTSAALLLRPIAQEKARRVISQLRVSQALFDWNATYESISAALARGADPNFNSRLWYATVEGNQTLVEQLLAYGADVNRRGPDGTLPLVAAARNNHPEITEILVKHGAGLTDLRGGPDVAWVASTGNADLLKRLLKQGGNPNAVSYLGRTALIEAAAAGHVDCIKLLLAAGANVNALSTDGYTALMVAENEFYPEAAADLRVAGASERPNIAPTPLYGPVALGDIERAKQLLAHGTDPNRPDRYGRPPLAAALEGRRYEIANLLLDAGANPSDGRAQTGGYADLSSLYLLVYYGNESPACLALLKRLLATGLDVNSPRGHYGQTPLMAAIVGRKTELLRVLLQAGARVDPRDQQGHTALALAIQSGNISAVSALREAGAQP